MSSGTTRGQRHWATRYWRIGDEIAVAVLPTGTVDLPLANPPSAKEAALGPEGPVRFEVSLNDAHLCVAGVEEWGTMGAFVSWVLREPSKYDPASSLTFEEWCQPETLLQVGALVDRNTQIRWIEPTPLSVGDVVHIRILPPGEFDPPLPV